MLWISSEVRLRQVPQRIGNLWLKEIQIQVVDGTSGTDIPPTIGMPGDSGENLPHCHTGGSSEKIREFTIISDKPVFFRIQSEGYLEQWLQIKEESPHQNIVRL
ncbi:hypothetical protein GCM10023212_42440 [Luteolibacter yonseiensis]